MYYYYHEKLSLRVFISVLFFLYKPCSIFSAMCRREVKLIAFGGIIRALTAAFNVGGSITFIFGTTFLVYAGTGGELTAQKVFTTLSLVNVLRQITVIFVVDAFYLMYEASVANTRIQVSYVHGFCFL